MPCEVDQVAPEAHGGRADSLVADPIAIGINQSLQRSMAPVASRSKDLGAHFGRAASLVIDLECKRAVNLVSDLKFRNQEVGCEVQGVGRRIQGSGLKFRVPVARFGLMVLGFTCRGSRFQDLGIPFRGPNPKPSTLNLVLSPKRFILQSNLFM